MYRTIFRCGIDGLRPFPAIMRIISDLDVSKLCTVILVMVLSVGGFVRIWGITFGLPHLYHPDEGYLIMPALKILHTGNFNPGRFEYGSVFIYILFFAYIAYFLAGVRQGVFQVVEDIPFHDDFSTLVTYEFPTAFLVGRLVSAFFGTALILLVFFLAKRLYDSKTGILASLLLALFPPLVLDAHFATTDTAVTFFITLAIVLSFRLFERGAVADYLLAGFVTGIAVSAKYAAFPVIVTPIVAHMLRERPLHLALSSKLFVVLGAVPLGFLVGSPFILADFPTFLNDLAMQVRIYAAPGMSSPILPTPLWWLQHLLGFELLPLTLLSSIGLGYLLKQRRQEGVILVVFLLFFWSTVLSQTLRYPRTWLPTAPVLILLASDGLMKLGKWLSRFSLVRDRPVWIAPLVLLCLFWGSVSWQRDWRLAQTDVRTEAIQWVQENIPINSRVAIDLGGPPLPDPPWRVERFVKISVHPYTWYKAEGFDYLIISQPLRNDINMTPIAEENYRTIEVNGDLVGDLVGYWLDRADQHLWIYRVSDLQPLGGR